MSTRPKESGLWPAQTPAAESSSSSSSSSTPRRRSTKRRRILDLTREPHEVSSLPRRQTLADQQQIAQAEHDCQFNSGNDVMTCYPTSETVVFQHQWVQVVWNSRLPEFTQINQVDAYLFRADSRQQILHFQKLVNPSDQAGSKPAQVNDSWFGADGDKFNGTRQPFPFFWIVKRSDQPLNGNEIRQPIFTAIQTTVADSVASSMASQASVASESSRSAASLTATSTSSSVSSASTSSNSASGSVQHPSGSSSFPHWAIAVIVVLGFLAIVALCILAFLIIRRIRRRQEIDSNRNSMGSASPMMANAGHESPLLGGAAVLPPPRLSSAHGHSSGAQAPSVVMHDGASTISRTGSAGDTGPFSGADAAIMADAFRKMLRKPDFAGRPVEEGDSPENPEQKEHLINRELAEEGRDIRSVSSSRGVKVETLSDSGDTVQDHSHHQD